MSFDQLIDHIWDIASQSKEDISQLHNSVCTQQITYIGDGNWGEKGAKSDNKILSKTVKDHLLGKNLKSKDTPRL